MKIDTVGVLGAGVIGASWSALFLASGRAVRVYDPSPDAEKFVRDYVCAAWETLTTLGLAEGGDPETISFHDTPETAVDGALFVQESVPERIDVKRELFARAGWRDPAPLILGHPFNPPHLTPTPEDAGASGR